MVRKMIFCCILRQVIIFEKDTFLIFIFMSDCFVISFKEYGKTFPLNGAKFVQEKTEWLVHTYFMQLVYMSLF